MPPVSSITICSDVLGFGDRARSRPSSAARSLRRYSFDLDGENLGCAAGARHGNGEQSDRAAAGDGHRSWPRYRPPARCAPRCPADRGWTRTPAESTGRASIYSTPECTTYSANAPLASTPMIFTCWQMCASPVRHCRHLPQATCISAETKSPSFTRRDFFAHGGDRAAKFVSGNQRRMNAVLRPRVPVINVQVGAADARRLHLHEHVAEANLGDLDLTDLGARLGLGLYHRQHGVGHGNPRRTRKARANYGQTCDFSTHEDAQLLPETSRSGSAPDPAPRSARAESVVCSAGRARSRDRKSGARRTPCSAGRSFSR